MSSHTTIADHDKSKRGFTLIELLVVITIIVVLLALLTPALDKAIYQAEMVVCAANHKAIGTGVTQYAMGNKRRYPVRQVQWVPEALAVGAIAAFQGGPADDRPIVRDYLSMDAYLCPMAGEIDLDSEDSEIVNKGFIKSSSALWYGWQYRDAEERAMAGMFKLGDRWSWNNVRTGDVTRFTTTSQDNVIVYEGGGNENYTAHPDDDGVFTPIEYDFESTPGLPTVRFLWAGWWGPVTHDRGLVDINASAADGSVTRELGVDWDRDNEVHDMPSRMEDTPRGKSPEDDVEYILAVKR